MARLPTPGSDKGEWGEILNDYLGQSLAADGTLKNGTVGTNQIANGAVTTNKIQDGSITAAKLATDTSNPSTGINSLFIFYSPPNIVNGKYSDDYAAGMISRYNDAILPTGLQDPGDTYHASTANIIEKVAAISPDTRLWGYVDAGVSTNNLPLATIQAQIDQWIDMGVYGIFIDRYGYEYLVPRSRQNDIVNYIHGKGLPAFINAWNADDAFGSSIDLTYNPLGTPTAATEGDMYLLESWVCNSDAYAAPYFASLSDIKTRGDKAMSYRQSLGIKIYATNIMLHTGTDEATLARYFGICEGLARAWRLDGSGMSASNYSSLGSDLGVFTPRFSPYLSLPQRIGVPYVLNNTWTEVYASDLGITVTYDPGAPAFDWKQL